MRYSVVFSDRVRKQLKKIDPYSASRIVNWIGKNLVDTDDPRRFGKSLTGNRANEWRYRIGQYRLLCEINDNKMIIHAIAVGHRKSIYKK